MPVCAGRARLPGLTQFRGVVGSAASHQCVRATLPTGGFGEPFVLAGWGGPLWLSPLPEQTPRWTPSPGTSPRVPARPRPPQNSPLGGGGCPGRSARGGADGAGWGFPPPRSKSLCSGSPRSAPPGGQRGAGAVLGGGHRAPRSPPFPRSYPAPAGGGGGSHLPAASGGASGGAGLSGGCGRARPPPALPTPPLCPPSLPPLPPHPAGRAGGRAAPSRDSRSQNASRWVKRNFPSPPAGAAARGLLSPTAPHRPPWP